MFLWKAPPPVPPEVSEWSDEQSEALAQHCLRQYADAIAAAQRAGDAQQLWKLACRAAEDFLEVRVRDEREA
eukprot:7536717-Alexandrium_andersonii.AAC.1